MSDAVNHPGYYEKSNKGEKHIECIHLMAMICEGYSGIAAFDIGQCKYIYRCGCKTEMGMENKDKAVQDANKYGWYLKDFKSRALQNRTSCYPEYSKDELLPEGFYCNKTRNEALAEFIADEYTFDKDERVKPIIRDLIETVYCMKTFRELDFAIEDVETLAKELSK